MTATVKGPRVFQLCHQSTIQSHAHRDATLWWLPPFSQLQSRKRHLYNPAPYLGRIGPMDLKDPPIQQFILDFDGSRSFSPGSFASFCKFIWIWIKIWIYFVVKISCQKGSGTSGSRSIFQPGSERTVVRDPKKDRYPCDTVRTIRMCRDFAYRFPWQLLPT